MEYLLQINDLSKKYWRKKALDGLNLSINKGKIVGLLGPNGTGKTTLIKIIAGLLNYDSGEVLIDGLKPGVHTKAIVSYLPDKDFLYDWMTVEDSVIFLKDFFKDFDEKKAYELIKFMKLDPKDKVTSLSKGMKERLNLALILSRKAKIYLLDEPLAAVDPATREKIINAIIKNFNEDSTIIISTHLINDVERLFDEVAFIGDGKILLHEEVEALKEERGKSLEDIFKEVFREW